jgi:hypothetical protein
MNKTLVQLNKSRNPPTIPRMLAELTDPRRFPALAKFLGAGVFEIEDGPDDEFIFGLGPHPGRRRGPHPALDEQQCIQIGMLIV